MKVTQTPYSPYFISRQLPNNQLTIQVNSGSRSGSLSNQSQLRNTFKDSSIDRSSVYIKNMQKPNSSIIHRPQSEIFQKAEQEYGIQTRANIYLPTTAQDIRNLTVQIEKIRKQISRHSEQIKVIKSVKQPETQKFQILLKEVESQYEKRFDVHMTSIMGTIIDIKKEIDSTVQQIRLSRQQTLNTQENQKSHCKNAKPATICNPQTKSRGNIQIQQKIRREMQDRIKACSNRLKTFFQTQIQKINSAINLIKIEQKSSILKTSAKSQKKYLFNSIKLTYKEFVVVQKQEKLQDGKQYQYGYCFTPNKSLRNSTLQSSGGSQRERKDYFSKSNSKVLLKSTSYSRLSSNDDETQLSQKVTQYFMDPKGYLLDQNNYYLTDQKGHMIQINVELKQKMQKMGLLKL